MKSPNQISGLVGWWHANAVTLSGSDVTAWPDQSDEGHDLTATGTPTFDAVDKGIVFPDSTSHFLSRTDALGMVGSNPAMTIVARVGDRVGAAGTTKRWLHIGANTGVTGSALHLATDISTRYENGAKVWGSNPAPTSGYESCVFVHPADGDYDATDLYIGGVLATPTAAGSTTTVNMTDGAFMLGAADSTAAPAYSAGVTVKEIAVFNRALTAQEIADVSAYLDSELMGTVPATGAAGEGIINGLSQVIYPGPFSPLTRRP